MRGKWLLFAGIVILAAIGAGAISVLLKPAPKPAEKAAEKPVGLQLGDEIALNGKIQAARVVGVRAPVDGTLESWEVEQGQDVIAGQPLGRVKNTSLEAAQEQAQMELDRAQNRVTNIEGSILTAKLEAARADGDAARAKAEADMLEKQFLVQQNQFRQGALARLKFEKTEQAYNTAKLDVTTATGVAVTNTARVAKLEKDLELAKKNVDEKMATFEDAKSDLEASVVSAPVDGTVLALKVEAGGEVNRSMLDLVQLAADPALLQVVVEPEAAVLKLLQPGQPALVLVPEVTAEGLAGEVKSVKDNEAIVEFTSPNPAIKHGMQAGVRIKLVEVENGIPRK